MTRLAATLLTLACLAPDGAATESLVATRSILARSVIGAEDIRVAAAAIPGAMTDASEVVGMEAMVTIYEGRPVRRGDIGAPALIERNDIVRLRYRAGPLDISTEGRALDRGAEGDRVRVMNLASRSIVAGTVSGAASVEVAR